MENNYIDIDLNKLNESKIQYVEVPLSVLKKMGIVDKEYTKDKVVVKYYTIPGSNRVRILIQ